MSAELQLLQVQLQEAKNDALMARKEAEIIELKFQLQIAKNKKVSKLEDSLFAPDLYEHYSKVAERMAKSNLVPKDYQNRPDDIFLAIAKGYQLGLPVEQCLENIAVINGRACVWGDSALAIVISHPHCEYVKEGYQYDDRGNITGAFCTVKRRGYPEHTEIFTKIMAAKAKLIGKPGPWSQYEERMLKLRARGFAIRDKFADALKGIPIAEEVYDNMNVIDGQVVDPEPKNEASLMQTQTERVKEKLKSNGKGLKNESYSSSTSANDVPNSASNSYENQSNSQETEQVVSVQPMAEPRKEEIPVDESVNPDAQISEKQRETIDRLLKQKTDFKKEYKEFFNSYNVPAVKNLTKEQAEDFIFKLESL
jgi:hypothetical protein